MLSQPSKAVTGLSWNWGCAWQYWWQNLEIRFCLGRYHKVQCYIYTSLAAPGALAHRLVDNLEIRLNSAQLELELGWAWQQTHTLIPLYMRMAWVFNTYLAWYLYGTTLLLRDIVTAWNCYGVTMLWPYIRRLKYEHTHWYFDRWKWHNMSVWQLPGMISCCGVTLLQQDIVAAWQCYGLT